MNSTRRTLQSLTEVPLGGDPPFPDRFAPQWGQKNATAKNQVRDDALTTVREFFSDAKPAGQFSINFTSRGKQYSIRMTSSAVRLMALGQVGSFDVSGCDRTLGIRIACAAVQHLFR
jgi:hypothetical protein